METRMDSKTKFSAGGRVIAKLVLAGLLLGPASFFLNGCYMTPEDKAFYGRGWINPDELDVEQPPPRAFTDPTSIQPHMMGPGEY
jgi:hypothetical protein